MSLYNAAGLFAMLGVTSNPIKSGPNKDIGNPLRRMTDEERAILQGMVNSFYDQFVQVVSHRPRIAGGARAHPGRRPRLHRTEAKSSAWWTRSATWRTPSHCAKTLAHLATRRSWPTTAAAATAAASTPGCRNPQRDQHQARRARPQRRSRRRRSCTCGSQASFTNTTESTPPCGFSSRSPRSSALRASPRWRPTALPRRKTSPSSSPRSKPLPTPRLALKLPTTSATAARSVPPTWRPPSIRF